jgi:Nitroreductase
MKNYSIILFILIIASCCRQKAVDNNLTVTTPQTESQKNEVIKTIMERRSIRAYKTTPVGRDTMDIIAKCGINAANGMNAQRWELRIVDDTNFINSTTRLFIEKMKSDPRGAKMVSDSSFKNMYRNAPTIVFIATEKGEALIDCGLLAGNMLLSAKSMGIGSCCLGGPVRFFDSPEAKKYLDKLDFSEQYKLALIIGFGYPDQTPEAKPRDESKIKWYN